MLPADHLEQLAASARDRAPGGAPYAGEVTPGEAHALLAAAPEALLIDVRTPEEWASTGIPALPRLAKIAWRLPMRPEPNPDFLDGLREAQPDPEAPVFFLCKIGGRSFEAANAAAMAGYRYAFNVTHGFEGDADAAGRRGGVNGWKAEGLPWQA